MNPPPGSVRRFLSRLALGMALCLLPASLPAATLVAPSTPWRWRPGTNEASTPIPAWRTPDFDDREFTTAPAPFWYGDVLPGGTQIQGMQNVYSCIFLRHTFVVTDPSQLTRLTFVTYVDDGLVAWINGTEVARVGVAGNPGSEVTIATLAANASEPVEADVHDLPTPATYLRPGTNVLAVQVFQSNPSSSDLGFDCLLDATVPDTNAPAIFSVSPAPGSEIDALPELTVTFTEPVAGVVAAHLLVNGVGATDVTQIASDAFTFKLPPLPYGTLSVTWNPRQTITDFADPPNAFDPAGPGATWQYRRIDHTPPAIFARSPAAGSTVRSLASFTLLFTEPVAGVDPTDLLINDHPATAVSPTGPAEFIVSFPEPAPGPVRVAWAPGHGITDLANPANAFTGTPWTYTLDPNAPEPAPYISEFLASNTRTFADDFGEFSDWIEIFNPSATPVDLGGWYLTDAAGNLTKWSFPATPLPAGGFLVVRASGRDLRRSGAPLHTGFQLGAGGEYLALVRPDGLTVASEFRPTYPQQLPDVSFGLPQESSGDTWVAGTTPLYFTKPTPGAPNLGGTAVPGPVILDVQHSPNVPLDDQDLLVTARIAPSFRPVASVDLRYRIMFGSETNTPMFDDGAHGDGAAGDLVYGATIPANLSTNGQMIRYLVAATDTAANRSRWPLFPEPNSTEEYLGTIVNPTNVVSKLPVFHLFVAPAQLGRIDSESGGRLSFFYDGEFYDNIYMELRGNTSAGLNKKSHRLEFNRGHELRHAGPGGRTRRSSLLAEHLDPACLRQHLCYWVLDHLGVPAPFDYPVRVQLNGQFYQLAFHGDVIGKEQMERMGYDPRGALYKAVGTLTPDFNSTGVFQKLEPETDPTRTDYLALATGIHESRTPAQRRVTVFDLLDVPQVVNHLAGARWCSENDDVWANMSIYRDTFGDGLWRLIPFDMNASWGQLYGGSSPLEATIDNSKSHPLYGGSSTEGNFNRLYDVIVQLPETRQMLLRRERSLLDQLIQPPETPLESRILETYVRQMTNLIAAEAALDRAKWGSRPGHPARTSRVASAICSLSSSSRAAVTGT